MGSKFSKAEAKRDLNKLIGADRLDCFTILFGRICDSTVSSSSDRRERDPQRKGSGPCPHSGEGVPVQSFFISRGYRFWQSE